MAAPAPVAIPQPHTWTDGGDKVLVLVCIAPDGTSRSGTLRYRWPDGVDVEVISPDWEPTPNHVRGLLGWPWGMGFGGGTGFDFANDRWLVVSVDPADIVDSPEGYWQSKYCRCVKLYDGAFAGAWALIADGQRRLIEAMDAEGGHRQQRAVADRLSRLVTAGLDNGLVAAGLGSAITAAGACSRLAEAGGLSHLLGLDTYSRLAAAGSDSRLVTIANAGRLAASGARCYLAAAGANSCLAAAGHESCLSAIGPNSVVAAAHEGCQVQVGPRGVFALAYWESDEVGWRFVTGKVGENGIKANTWYEVIHGRITEVAP